jgi:glycosyl transferase family 87
VTDGGARVSPHGFTVGKIDTLAGDRLDPVTRLGAAGGRRLTRLGHLPGATLLALLALVIAGSQHRLWWHYPIGVDLEIPLRAAQRWIAGGDAYLAAAFHLHGVDLPFLYPPFVLPIVAPLSDLPRAVVVVPWLLLLVAVAYASARRLGFGPLVAGLVLLWPPYAEALMGGNVQILLFGAYIALMYRDGRQLDPRDRERPAIVDGALGVFVGAVKVSQVHAWVYVLRRRPTAAALGLLVVGVVVLVTLPLLGTDRWLDWVAQASRAADPSLGSIGFPLSTYTGLPISLAVAALSVVAVFAVPPRQAGAWIGILTVIGSASPHIFAFLFLLPAMRLVPRGIGLIAALLIATYVAALIWCAVALVSVALAVTDRDIRLDHRVARLLPGNQLAR